MVEQSTLQKIIVDLEQHPEIFRIKKLLIFTAIQRWESKPEALERLSLKRIVKKNIQKFPSHQAMEQILKLSVGRLSRQWAYRPLIDDILTCLLPLLAEQEEPTTGTLVPLKTTMKSATELSLERAAADLERHPEHHRLKKILYALCFQCWENRESILGEQTITALLRQILITYPSYQRFTVVLHKLIALLNRQKTYRPLAITLTRTIAPLYQHEGDRRQKPLVADRRLAGQPLASPPPTVAEISQQEPIAPKQSSQVGSDLDEKATMVLEDTALLRESIEAEPIQSSQTSFARTLEEDSSLTGLHAAKGADPHPVANKSDDEDDTMLMGLSDQKTASGHQGSQYGATTGILSVASDDQTDVASLHGTNHLDFQELKAEVMKTTNPLRAKIVLFSFLQHPFNLSGSDWSALRTYDLAELLRAVIQQKPHFEFLQTQLIGVSQMLFDPNDHLQAAQSILQAIAPYLDSFSE